MRRAFYYDQSRCMACNACTVACKDCNGILPGPVRWRYQRTYGDETANYEAQKNLRYYNLSIACNHCKEPACLTACTSGAVSKRDDGVVFVDRTKCIGLLSCIQACPYGKPQIAGDKQEPERNASWSVAHPMQKCDFCRSRIDSGKQPICVAACPNHALDSGDYDELLAKYPGAVQLSKSAFPYAYPDGYGADTTQPSFLIKKRS